MGSGVLGQVAEALDESARRLLVHHVDPIQALLERKFEDEAEHGDRLESDAFDGAAVHCLIFHRPTGEAIGTTRLIPLSGVENLAYIAGASIAVLVAVVASLAPARRAASVHPMVAMRSE